MNRLPPLLAEAKEIMSSKKVLQIVSLSVFFLLIAGYGLWGSHNLIFGVTIKKVSIAGEKAQSGAKIQDSVIKITGNAKNAIVLTLNGREITINVDGDFNETIALLPGYNIINITAKDKFGYVDEKNYKLIH